MRKNNKGFSLIEIMVGITIVIFASTMVLTIIISSFRISSKTTVSSVIRQNGNYALSQASRMLQFADSFTSVTCGGITYPDCRTAKTNCNEVRINYNGVDKRITCSTSTGIGINSTSSIDTVKFIVSSCNFTCSQDSGEAPVIGIDFELATRGTNAVEKSSKMNFSTSVKMRNN